ncbi:unnamed protein product, partial [Prorocentrum cordatum]
ESGLRAEGTEAELNWVHAIVTGLNYHYARSWSAALEAPPSAVQRQAHSNLLYEVRVLCDQCSGTIPIVDWESELTAAATSHDGEEVFPAEPLDRSRLLEALPPIDACAAVKAVDVAEGWIQAALSDPRLILKNVEEIGDLPPTPKAWASNSEWELIGGDLVTRGILKPIEYEEIAEVRGQKIMGGMFGVKKGSHVRGEGPQRLVMNIIPSNLIQRAIEGVLLWSAEDLKCCFYVYSLCDAWLKYMAISKPVRRAAVGLPGAGLTYLAAVVVPVGWISVGGAYDDGKPEIYIGRGSSKLNLEASTWGNPYRMNEGWSRQEVITLYEQYLHESPQRLRDLASLNGARRLCHCRCSQACHGDVLIKAWKDRFGSMSVWRAWQVYIDNLDVLEITDWWQANQLQEKGVGELAQVARERYQSFGVPRSENKAVIREVKSQSLGEAIDGAQGTIVPPAQFVQRLVSLTIETLRRKVVAQKWMQILAGRWVRCLLFRREAMMCFTELWRFLVRIKGQASLPAKVREELIAARTLLPLLRCDLRVPISGLVTVSDASMQRGAVCRSVLLRRDGVAAARAASRRLVTDFRDEVVLVSLFDGIGGARRALGLLGLAPALFVSAEIDAVAKRVTKYAWPEVLEVGDAQSFGYAEAMAIRDRAPHIKWILLIGGSPCTDLARINVERVGLQGRRSKLFFEITRARLLLEEVLGEFCRLVTLIENVASMDVELRNVMSERLGHQPVRVEASCITHCYRDRLYWIDENLLCEWQGDVSVSEGVKMIHVLGGPGPVRRWLSQDLKWAGDAEELQRWRDFEYCYAPYQFKNENCIEEPNNVFRPPNSVERELLLDFLPGHTITARVTRARKLEKHELEATRCSLLGNSFQCVVVAWILSHWAVKFGYLHAVPSVVEMRDLGGGAAIEDASVTLDDVNHDEGVPIRQHNLEEPDAALDPSAVIVAVRLDTFEAMRPDLWPRRPISVARWTWRATAIWEWERPSHITDLEVCAAARCQCVDFAACERQQIRPHPRTLDLYRDAVRQFSDWVASRGLTWTGASDHVDKLDLLVAEWIEWLRTEGHPQGLAGNALSAVQFFLRKKRILPASWRLLRAWQNLELPQRVLPLPEVVLLAMAATARGWGRDDIAVLLVLGFAGFLRTTEMLTLRRWQIAIDEARAKIVIILPITKSGLRYHRQGSVVIDDPSVVQLASFLLRHLSPEALIPNSSISEFRDKFEQLCTALECQQF